MTNDPTDLRAEAPTEAYPENLAAGRPPSAPSPAVAITAARPIVEGDEAVLGPDALAFVARLEERFGARIEQLLTLRASRRAALAAGASLDFDPLTKGVRKSDWKVEPPPPELLDRRVEITGPVDAKTVINALNSPAQCFMADFEDSTCPTFENLVAGQINLMGAVRGTLRFEDAARGKSYRLNEQTAVLHVRPRGLHMIERHVEVEGRPMHAALFDAGLFLFHNAAELIARGTAPYLYIPKLEDHREAELWNDVLVAIELELGLAKGIVRTTVLIETLPAAFQMDEILWSLRERCVGLNCGRWDYIFSYLKCFRDHASRMLPDRERVGMNRPFLAAYSRLLIETCHRRGALAMGGMAAQIPLRDDPEGTTAALAAVADDKRREAEAGHDGTWVAHPGLIETARAAFGAVFDGPNQLDRVASHSVSSSELVSATTGRKTLEGLRANLDVALRYVEAWLRGIGCVAIHGRMEDAATAEIARTQVWHWCHHRARLATGEVVDPALVETTLDDVMRSLREELGESDWKSSRFDDAHRLLRELVLAEACAEFLTTPAYELV